MRSRRDEVADYFTQNAGRLEQGVAAKVIAPRATIEDACAYAWCELVRREDIRLTREGYWWLHQVATHEAWQLCERARREIPSGDHDGPAAHHDTSRQRPRIPMSRPS